MKPTDAPDAPEEQNVTKYTPRLFDTVAPMPLGDERFVHMYNEMLERIVQINLAHPIHLKLYEDYDRENKDLNICIDRVCELRRTGEDERARVCIVEGVLSRGMGRDRIFYRCVVLRGDRREEPFLETREHVAPDNPEASMPTGTTRRGFEFL